MRRSQLLRCSRNCTVAPKRVLRPFPVSSKFRVTAVATDDEISTKTEQVGRPPSLHTMTNEEWRAKFEKNGTVDLFTKDEFSAGSFMVGGRAVFNGGVFGFGTGEGPSAGNCAVHKVTIKNHATDETVEVHVPEDRYILWEAEDHDIELPYSCRMGCCTACAVKVHEGQVFQPQSLGISPTLKESGYALMCVSFPMSDCVMETVPEDEVYDLQFGQYFAKYALDPNADSIIRDDFAIELATGDE